MQRSEAGSGIADDHSYTLADVGPLVTYRFGVSPDTLETCCPVVELRRYTLRAGARDTLIDLFDREFIETQEAVGMKPIGQFRDVDDPDHFVWLRGFRDMETRARGLAEFYGGPVWKQHREVANATMIDSDNVLLLRPARPSSDFGLEQSTRPPPGSSAEAKGLVVATVYYLGEHAEDGYLDFFESELIPALSEMQVSVLAYFVTEQSENDFPALPVREGMNVLAWFASFPTRAAYDDHLAALGRSRRWRDELLPAVQRRIEGDPEVLRLSPTPRSLLRP